MMAGLVDILWTIEDLYDAVTKQQADKKHGAEKLLKKLRSLQERAREGGIEPPRCPTPTSSVPATYSPFGTCPTPGAA